MLCLLTEVLPCTCLGLICLFANINSSTSREVFELLLSSTLVAHSSRDRIHHTHRKNRYTMSTAAAMLAVDRARQKRDSSEEPSVAGSSRKKQKTSHYQTPFDVVDNLRGDVVIQVGTGEDVGIVRAHKSCLIMSSPVFQSMLAGEFKEAGKVYDTDNPLVLEDDRTAFIDFCVVIHNQSKGDKRVPLSRAASVAVIFDKYCCTELLLQYISWPLREYFGPTVGQADLTELRGIGLRIEDVLCISYVAGDAKLFHRCTKLMARKITPGRGYKQMKTDKALLALMPDIIPSEFSERSIVCSYILTRGRCYARHKKPCHGQT
jgi:hypothetical protein